MSVGQQASIQQSSNTWTEPPWSGWIETTGDALLILEAARRGLIPRVTRRLVDSERKMITSGSVFVFDEDESGIKRWTDGFFWSPSRILGNFLLYRETDKRGAGHRSARTDTETTEPSTFSADGTRAEGQSLSRPKTDNTALSVDKQRERTLMGSLTNSYKFKSDGLMKKTFSVTINGVAQHLISYYKIEDVENGRLRSPSSLPELASLDISPEYLDKTHFRNPPKVEIDFEGVPRYRGEADDIESSPSILTAPLSSDALLSHGRIADAQGASKRGKRYDPYRAGSGSPPLKRPRRNTKTSQPDSSSTPTAEPISPQVSTSSATPQPGQPPPPATVAHPVYPDPNVPLNIGPPHHPPPGSYPYGVTAFYPMTGYPPPPGHMYPAPGPPHQVGVGVAYPPPPGAGPAQAPPPQSGPPYAYAGYPHPPPSAPPVHHSDPSQAGHAAAPPQPQPQPYYSYYTPHPPPGYPQPYQWPVYSGYPPQPQPVQHPPPPLHTPVAHPKARGAGEASGSGGSGAGGDA